ncbi:ATP-binding cassette domain-containing protein [Apilactobacillus ozensis]|uniref:ATP-binding cassette domain-containing protein n=1 Tax=Apilactobacillus ozensis TaxID=866801 RepID=UPI00200A5D1D|nr:ABC transporter ATP-binding protein [Apilactobacillus ozensis]MCK8606734.1 energy-coupling factor ABC transporter ATP-binding protein [Apilactobacillus ozensis]
MLEIKDFSYRVNENYILKNVNMKFTEKTISVIQGPSGCGKSTLLKSIAKLYPKYSNGKCNGTITLNHEPLKKTGTDAFCKQISIMFQNPNYQFAMETVQDELIFTLENINTNPKLIEKKARQALGFCEIAHLANRKIATLSGGEKQKVSLAIIYAIDSPVILLDEPFVNVDQPSVNLIIDKLNVLKREHHKTIIIVDHNTYIYYGTADFYYKFDENKLNFKPFNAVKPNNLSKLISLNTTRRPFDNIITLQNFEVANKSKELLSINNFSFKNGITLLTGDNGTGKSSLFKAITKSKKYRGNISLAKMPIRKMSKQKLYKKVGLIFQNADTQFMTMTVQEEINLSYKKVKNGFYNFSQIQDAIKLLNLDALLNRVIYTLSEGQKKKVQILSMLIMSNPILLLDEPFNGLDNHSLHQILKLLKNAKEKFNQSMIIISHRFDDVGQIIDHHVNLSNHKLVNLGSEHN